MDTWRQVAGVLGVALLFGGAITNAADLRMSGADAAETFDFDIPALPLRGAAETFARLTGGDIYIGHEAFESCGDFILKPLAGRLTAKEAWTTLTSPICAASGVVVEERGAAPVYMVDHPWVVKREIRIPKAPLIDVLGAVSHQFGGLLLEYRPLNKAQEQTLVGPIAGHMDPEEALQRIEEQLGATLNHRRTGPYTFLLEPSAEETEHDLRYLYGRKCLCPVSTEGPLSATVTVVKPAISDVRPGNVVTLTRKDIESTGASTLPELFRYISQNGYSRPAGYIASGAQYADFRGFGWDTHLITINGRRTLPSANNVSSSAFDLNTIPLPAVEAVELRSDSASMRYGSDAIAGTIDIVTRRRFDGEVELRYGFASGGAEEQRTTLSLSHELNAGRLAGLFDYFELGDLRGRERPLSRDQNYVRYGGADYRKAFTIRSVDGRNLTGLDAPLAGLPDVRASDHVSVSELTPGEPQMLSLSNYYSLVPAGKRLSFVGSGDYAWRAVRLSGDVLWVRRDAGYQYHPAIASGVVGADHPGNPFDEPVRIDALLSGAPSMQQHVQSQLRRAVASAQGDIRKWSWELSVIASDETAEAWVDHTLDPAAMSAALLASDESSALDVFAMQPGGPGMRADVWAQPRTERFSSSGAHVVGSMEGPVGPARLRLGLEQREEAMQFSSAVGRVERDVRGEFAHVAWPWVRPEMKVAGVNQLTGFMGVRRDSFSDGDAVTRKHFELRWGVTDDFVLNANVAQQYRPPSLFELNLPPVAVPIQIFDSRRAESVAALLISGGNRQLRPTTGRSTNIQATYSSPGGLVASANYFSLRLWNRVAVLPLQLVLAAEDQLEGRVGRVQTPEEAAAGRPGRLTFVNTTRDNVGRMATKGLDLSLHQTFDTALGAFTPRADVTWIDSFEYSDSPAGHAPMIDRVGIASEQGTITRWRAVASLRWRTDAWAATTYLRLIPAYEDVGGGRIRSQQLWDLNVSYMHGERLTLTLGAMDILDTSPPFARVGAATGYDSSQWDPVGRRVMLTAKLSL